MGGAPVTTLRSATVQRRGGLADTETHPRAAVRRDFVAEGQNPVARGAASLPVNTCGRRIIVDRTW